MVENAFLKTLYVLFLGILIATFVGVGVKTFYEGPKAPTMSAYNEALKSSPENCLSSEEKAKLQADQNAQDKYMEDDKGYNQNVSIILLAAAVILVAASIFTESRTRIFSDGIMLGGLITLVHSIVRGMISENKMYLFIATTAGLAVVAYLGYHRFVANKGVKAVVDKK